MVPLFTLCALVTIILSCACLKISVKRTTSATPDAITSLSKEPGPTDGSWSTSPTSTSLVPGRTAARKLLIKSTSIMEVSSKIMTSASIGALSLRSNAIYPWVKFTPRSRWMVFASRPVVSAILFAARPVGAARATRNPSASKTLSIVLTVVVFPVPGPPVRTTTELLTAFSTASF